MCFLRNRSFWRSKSECFQSGLPEIKGGERLWWRVDTGHVNRCGFGERSNEWSLCLVRFPKCSVFWKSNRPFWKGGRLPPPHNAGQCLISTVSSGNIWGYAVSPWDTPSPADPQWNSHTPRPSYRCLVYSNRMKDRTEQEVFWGKEFWSYYFLLVFNMDILACSMFVSQSV